MKKYLLNLFVFATSLGLLSSCSDQTLDPVATVNQNITVTAPTNGGNFNLAASSAGANATTIKWSAADFGFNAAIKYTLQVVKTTANFDSPQSFELGQFNSTSGIALEKTLTQRELNTLVLGAGGAIGASTLCKMRIVGMPAGQTATAANGVKSISQEVTFAASAFDTFDEFTRIYVPGSYGGASGFADWSGAGNSAKLFSKDNNGQYEGFVWMNVSNPEFKFNLDPTWSGNDKGENNPTGAFSGMLGTAQNIKPSDGAGTYFFTVNWNTQSYTMNKQQVAIIGAATPNGWGTPTYLDFDVNPASSTYGSYTKVLALAADEFLIRLKDDWSSKFGSTLSSTETLTSTIQNKIKFNGSNMKVPVAGNYKVVLSIGNSANYNIKLIPN